MCVCLTIIYQDLRNGEEVAKCPSCSLLIKVIYTANQLPEVESSSEAKEANQNTANESSTTFVPAQPAAIATH